MTVPPSGAPAHTLWDRFATAAGLPEVPVDLEVRRNPSLGAHSVAPIRPLNERLPVHDTWPLGRVMKNSLADGVLAHRTSQEPALEVSSEPSDAPLLAAVVDAVGRAPLVSERRGH